MFKLFIVFAGIFILIEAITNKEFRKNVWILVVFLIGIITVFSLLGFNLLSIFISGILGFILFATYLNGGVLTLKDYKDIYKNIRGMK